MSEFQRDPGHFAIEESRSAGFWLVRESRAEVVLMIDFVGQ